MSGNFGSNALLVIDGKPRNVAVGATVDGVRLLSLANNVAVVEVKGGQRVTLRLGDAQVNLGGKSSEGGGKQIVLTAQSGGHFYSAGTINGKAVRFMVDTGATNVAMATARGRPPRRRLEEAAGAALGGTANGDVPVSMLSLPSVRVGEVASTTSPPCARPRRCRILLGNSFLGACR